MQLSTCALSVGFGSLGLMAELAISYYYSQVKTGIHTKGDSCTNSNS